MTLSLSAKSRTALGLCGLLAALSMLGACALKETAEDSDTAGVVVNVDDSSNVVLTFDDSSRTVFKDSGSFNLDEIRQKMSDKGLDPDSIQITGIAVTYDSTTRDFITANEGVKFFLRIYLREEGTGERKLALETLENDIDEFKALAFDPNMAVLELGKHIFGNPEGFPDLLKAVKDSNIHSAWVIAELTVPGKIKKTGTLKINMVVTVAGKV
ncbi:MAG: hypothetical protein JWO30_3423 [Fibrobacteres bacterium]|nr:hypothetical protein [Fibrobacterota bacterium]